ncbi:MAG: quinolinate synthase NadA [Planctomycetota bacterium]|nr:MAG: quinolinate synthase NadA [Planctomycetota bacterium]
MKLTHWQPALPQRYLRLTGPELDAAVEARRAELGDALVILGHHYQADEVIRHADFTGDSFKLSQLAAERVRQRGARFVVFAGVHFMAESADILTPEDVDVILPDLSAGCSMADMADHDDVCDAWDAIGEALAGEGFTGRVVPITYMNSSAAIKAFVGEHGGAVCTSSNARRVFEWAFAGGALGDAAGDVKILFIPDQHLGRNTAAAMGLDVDAQTCVFDPRAVTAGAPLGALTPRDLARSRVILWAGHCSVHKLFRPEHCDALRAAEPDRRLLVHPECCKEVVDRADLTGSTEFIIRTIRDAEPGSAWAIGTEVHLVNRLAREARQRGVDVRILSDCQCLCTTMYRIDEPHLLWALDNLAQGRVVNRVRVHTEARERALTALDRMLSLSDTLASVD